MSDTGMVENLSTWDKIKIGAKGFAKAAIHYLPRGLLFVGALFGASALLGGFGMDFLGVSEAMSNGHIVGKVLTSLAIGATISGGVEAYKSVAHANQVNEAALQAQAGQLERARALGPERQQSIGFEDPKVPTGLPSRDEALVHTAAHMFH